MSILSASGIKTVNAIKFLEICGADGKLKATTIKLMETYTIVKGAA